MVDPHNAVLMAKLKEMCNYMNNGFTGVTGQMTAFKTQIDGVTTRLDVVSVDVTSLKTRQDSLEAGMKRMRCASSNASTAAGTPSPAKGADPLSSFDPWRPRPPRDMDKFSPCIEIK